MVDKHANATFVILARNSDLQSTVRSVREIEDRFNRRFRYPYVFLNEEPFTDEFKTCVLFFFFTCFFPIVAEDFVSNSRLSVLSSAKMEFGLIPRDHWFQPDSIDEAKAKASRDKMVEKNIIYGGSVSYRNMCRFNSGVSWNCQISFLPVRLLVALVLFPPPVDGEIQMVLAYRVSGALCRLLLELFGVARHCIISSILRLSRPFLHLPAGAQDSDTFTPNCKDN